MDQKERIYYWDNLKCFLIFLVVLGHFLIPINDRGRSLGSCYYLIYFFHMPAFVFVSGFFSKHYIEKGKGSPDITKIMGFLILYIIYKIFLWGISCFFQRGLVPFHLLEESRAPWYMLAMAVWYIVLPIFSKFKWYISIPATVLMSLYAGTNNAIGPFLCLSRIIVFFPFFLLGYYFKGEWIKFLISKKKKFAALLILIVITYFVIANLNGIEAIDQLIYGERSYAVLPEYISTTMAITIRLALFMIGILMTLCVMSWIPQRKLVVSYIGSRTLAIYILHRLVREILLQLGIFDKIPLNGIGLLIFIIIFCAGLTVLLANNLFHKCFNSVFKIKYDIIYM